MGADFLCKELEIQGQKITLQLWDTAGQERFQSLGIAFYRGSDVFVFVFSKGNRNSFNKVESFLEDFMSKVDTQPIMYLVGNKVDLESESVISLEEGSEKAMKLGMRYIETSALSGYQIDFLFQMIGTDVIERAIN